MGIGKLSIDVKTNRSWYMNFSKKRIREKRLNAAKHGWHGNGIGCEALRISLKYKV